MAGLRTVLIETVDSWDRFLSPCSFQNCSFGTDRTYCCMESKYDDLGCVSRMVID